MITMVLSLLGIGGIPAIVLGIAGKLGLSWLTGLMGGSGLLATILGPLVKLCMGLVDILMMILKWILSKMLAGLDHIIKSPSAVLTVIIFSWASFAYGHYAPVPKIKKQIERIHKKKAPAPTPRKKPSKSWIDRVLGS